VGCAEIKTELASRGYVLIKQFASENLLNLANKFGVPKGDSRNPDIIRDLFPMPTTESPRNTLSHRFGTGSFPFHPETAYWRKPIRYLFLYCVNPGSGSRPTLLIDPTEVLFPPEVNVLKSEIWTVNNIRHPFLSTIIDSKEHIFRFDPACMKPAGKDVKSVDILDDIMRKRDNKGIYWEPCDLLIIDNHRMLHARGVSKVPDPDRHLKRVIISEGGRT